MESYPSWGELEAVAAPSLQVSKATLDGAWSSWDSGRCPRQGAEGPFQPEPLHGCVIMDAGHLPMNSSHQAGLRHIPQNRTVKYGQ